MIRVATCFDPTGSSSGLHNNVLNTKLFILVVVNIVWDPTNVRSFIIVWYIMKASRVETCYHSNRNKLVVFDVHFLLLTISSENTSEWLP